MKRIVGTVVFCFTVRMAGAVGEPAWWKPYSPPCTERENVFAFTEKPSVKLVGKDRYEIAFAVKGNCDVTVGLVDGEGKVVRHLASGVLGANAPEPFQKNSLKQKIYWDGKDDLGTYVKEPGKLDVRVHPVPEHVENYISHLKLETFGVEIDKLTPEQEKYLASWNIGT